MEFQWSEPNDRNCNFCDKNLYEAEIPNLTILQWIPTDGHTEGYNLFSGVFCDGGCLYSFLGARVS